MKKPLVLLLFTILLLTGCAPKWEDSLYEQKPALYSYIIGENKNKQTNIEKNADAYITPASCQKVVTALLAYKSLGPDYQYQTTLYRSQDGRDNMLSFSGDPTLTADRLIELLEPLKNSLIKGTLILDMSAFQTPQYSPYWMITDIGSEPPISAMAVDWNEINLYVKPTSLGQNAKIEWDTPFYALVGEVLTTEDPSLIHLKWEGNTIRVAGHIQVMAEVVHKTLSPPDLDFYLGEKLKHVLRLLNIQANVLIIRDKKQLPQNTVEISHLKSGRLADFLAPALKKSDNLVFDSLYLTLLNQHAADEVRDWAEGDLIIKQLLKDYFGLDMETALFVDGSGLSRYNRIQTQQLFELLKVGYQEKDFVEALAVPGEIGTKLEKRMDLPKTVRAKTGTLSGINCLCGYNMRDGDMETFVFFSNAFLPPSREMHKAQDQFLKEYFHAR